MSKSNTARAIPADVAQMLAARALERLPYVTLHMWDNDRPGDSTNPADFSGTLKANTLKLVDKLIAALENGETEVAFHFDMWKREGGISETTGGKKPILYGRAKNLVKKDAAVDDTARLKAALEAHLAKGGEVENVVLADEDVAY